MKRNNYKSDFEDMYKEYYTGENDRCRYFNECQKNLEKPCVIESDKALVGNNYGGKYDGKFEIPKIVFVGLEGLNKKHKEVDIPGTDKPYNPHYKGVRYVLAYLLSPFIGMEQPDSVLKRKLKDYVATTEYFALLNCYKCAFGNNPKGRPHTSPMEENCPEILFREIEILEPDIVVFQAKGKPKDFIEKLNKRFSYSMSSLIYGNEDTGVFRCSFPSGKQFIWIWTYHGAGHTYSKKQGWACNDECGKTYREKNLDPVLDKAIEVFKQSRR